MGEPTAIEPERFFEFVGRPGVVVMFLSLSPAHRFNRALSRHFHELDGTEVRCGSVGMLELLLAVPPAIAFLRQELRAHGVVPLVDVLPGYYLFEHGRLVVWESGLPARADVETIVGASLLGMIGYALTRNVVLIGKALQLGAQEAAAARMAARFRLAAAEHRAAPRPPPAPPPSSASELLEAYRLLGVDPTASDREVSLAWRRRQAELHPDHAAGDPVEFERRSRLVTALNRARDVIRAHRSRVGWQAGGPSPAA